MILTATPMRGRCNCALDWGPKRSLLLEAVAAGDFPLHYSYAHNYISGLGVTSRSRSTQDFSEYSKGTVDDRNVCIGLSSWLLSVSCG